MRVLAQIRKELETEEHVLVPERPLVRIAMVVMMARGAHRVHRGSWCRVLATSGSCAFTCRFLAVRSTRQNGSRRQGEGNSRSTRRRVWSIANPSISHRDINATETSCRNRLIH